MEKLFLEGINYVRENKTWSEAEEQVALEKIDRFRCPLSHAYPSIAEEIRDLMDEFGEENDLPEDWWLDYGDEDEIFFKL